jgi:hypothetical protein
MVLSVVLVGCPSPEEPDYEFRVVMEDLPGSILSFWGSSSNDLFAVGGELGDPGEALIVWHDGQTWYRMPVDAPILWWVHGFAHDDVWAVGAEGTVVHFDGVAWTTVRSDPAYTLWGIWGSSSTDLWAVGGDVMHGVPSVLLHYDGTDWTQEMSVANDDDMYFKIWGSGPSDIWAVSERGVTIHYDGVGWTPVASGTNQRLITVNGSGPADVYAVGGVVESVLLHNDGTGWTRDPLDLSGGLMGVWTAPDQPVFVAGFSGLMALRDADGWRALPYVTSYCLHATWGDSQGIILGGGGNLLAGARNTGVIVGTGDIATSTLLDWQP